AELLSTKRTARRSVRAADRAAVRRSTFDAWRTTRFRRRRARRVARECLSGACAVLRAQQSSIRSASLPHPGDDAFPGLLLRGGTRRRDRGRTDGRALVQAAF